MGSLGVLREETGVRSEEMRMRECDVTQPTYPTDHDPGDEHEDPPPTEIGYLRQDGQQPIPMFATEDDLEELFGALPREGTP